MGIKFTNNALTLLAANISAADTIVSVAPGSGGGFPAVTGGAGDYFIVTMENAAAQREFIRVNHRLGDTFGSGGFPCVRGYFGSTPRAWTAGDSVDVRWSADVVQDYLTTISGRYLGAFVAAPVADAFGGPVKTGDLYYDTVLVNLLVWSGTAWVSAIALIPQMRVVDVEPAANKGEQWFESDTGNLYLRYQNPDLTYTWIGLNVANKEGISIPLTDKGAPNGVATLDATGKVPGAQLPTSQVLGYSQCRFHFVTSALCRLTAFGGEALTINNTPRIIPALGVDLTLAMVPLTSTTYYVYAFWTGTAIALEVSTTGWAVGGNSGMATKAGDVTRTLVGMVRKTGANTFVYSTDSKFVRTFYNDPGIEIAIAALNAFTLSAAPWVEPDVQARVFGLFWLNESVDVVTQLSMNSPAGVGYLYLNVGMDSPQSLIANMQGIVTSPPGGGYSQAQSFAKAYTITEGMHFFGIAAGAQSLTFTNTAGYSGITASSRRTPPY